MIVGCYDLHLYCDFPDNDHSHRVNQPGQFAGRTFADAQRNAKANGWHFHSDGERVICPSCVSAGRKLPRQG